MQVYSKQCLGLYSPIKQFFITIPAVCITGSESQTSHCVLSFRWRALRPVEEFVDGFGDTKPGHEGPWRVNQRTSWLKEAGCVPGLRHQSE